MSQVYVRTLLASFPTNYEVHSTVVWLENAPQSTTYAFHPALELYESTQYDVLYICSATFEGFYAVHTMDSLQAQICLAGISYRSNQRQCTTIRRRNYLPAVGFKTAPPIPFPNPFTRPFGPDFLKAR